MKDAIDIAFAITAVLAALLAAGHAIIYKRDSRSAAIWVLVVFILPALGAVAYAILGVNRVERRAVRMRSRMVRQRRDSQFPPGDPGTHFVPLARMVGRVCQRHLLPRNSINPLVDGGNAYPAMLEAIHGAKSTVAMASYIFDGDGIGAEFVNALAAATKRGGAEPLLIDDADARWSRPTAATR